MPIGPLIGAAVKLAAPKLAGMAAEATARGTVSMVAGRVAARGLASPTGQRLVSRVGGPRVASAVASPRGQKVVSMGVSHDVRKSLKGDETVTPAPAMPTTPVSEDINPNMMADPSTPIGRRQRQQGYQDNGTMGSRFGSAGGGWWTAQSIMAPMSAGYDWRTLDDTSVARGPAEWNMAGKGMGQRMKRRAGEFADGYRGANGEQVEPEAVNVDPYEWAKNSPAPTAPPRRTDSFNTGATVDPSVRARHQANHEALLNSVPHPDPFAT